MSDAPIPSIHDFAKPAQMAYVPMDMAKVLHSPAPPMEWLVEGFIPLGAPGALVAKPGCGKSQISLDLALCVALGLPFLGRKASPEPRSAIYLSMEDPHDEVHRRLERAMQRLVPEEDAPAARDLAANRLKVFFPEYRLGTAELSLQANRVPLVAVAKSFKDPCGLIILDTQNTLFLGEENSSRDSGAFWGECQALAEETCASVLVLHHLRKSSERSEAKTLAERLSPENLRGSSAIEGRARFVLVASPLSAGEAASVGLDPTQAHREDLVVLSAGKVNGASKGAWFLLERPVGSADGILRPHAQSESIVQQLQEQSWSGSSERKARKSLAWQVLQPLALAGGLDRVDRDLLLALIWPRAGTGEQQLQKQLGWLKKENYLASEKVTEAGITWLKNCTGVDSE